MSAADELRALTAAATPGPWDGHRHTIFEPIDNTPDGEAGAEVADVDHPEDLELIVWLVNHAQAIADLWDDNARLRAAIGTACTDLEGIDDHVADALLAALEADT